MTAKRKIVCPRCGCGHVQRNGFRITRSGRHQRYLCTACGHVFVPRQEG